MYGIQIDKNSIFTITRQLYDQLRNLILNNELKAGTKIPSSRNLSKELKISRIIVVEVYEQLIAEGFLNPRKGAGTFVADGAFLQNNKKDPVRSTSQAINTNKSSTNCFAEISFKIGIPDLSLFPVNKWIKVLKDVYQFAHLSHFGYTNPGGIAELKIKLAEYLLRSKGIRCYPEQVIILAGSSQCILTAAKLVADYSEKIIVEDPSYKKVYELLTSNQLKITPVPVDHQGIQISKIPENKKQLSMIITPSHHFPLGSILPIQRRIKLIEIVRNNQGYIIENDYDSEFKYTGQTVQALQTLDPDRVLHIGTFSETLFPSIRLGYLIVPVNLIAKCSTIVIKNELAVPSLNQLALAIFIEEGHLEKHINQMKKHYLKKRELLYSLLTDTFDNNIEILGDPTGLFLTVSFLNVEWNDKAINKLKEYQVNVDTVANHTIIKGKHKDKLILGFGSLSFKQIEEGINQLKKAVKDILAERV
ncbi:MAG: PLP-dependent aminotransferase family protein [Spirochaetes bacterium]|nr:PLP-dependent aminotransferase family protein [Spirochaetota bacterium]